MNWFFALNEASDAFPTYAELAKVAVFTARRATGLRPFLLYDGGRNSFTAWMEKHGVTLVSISSFLKPKFQELEDMLPPAFLSLLPGIFLRMELPRLGSRLGLPDRVLYTDCDVMFLQDVTAELEASPCRYFAVAPENDANDYQAMNTGVMLMNLAALREVDEEFREFVSRRLRDLVSEAWDQGAYRRFFGWEREKLWWDRLPAELNWKPYWGFSSSAKIVHFHGAKPYHRQSAELPESLRALTGGGFEKFARQWEDFRAEIAVEEKHC